ncbi:shikimate kinase [Marivirga sp.]|uniref:shikimate kinase n=1 Tax=Marivirga sp. TaxID=2018662 RepID=UPI002D808E07|nr:shikimate kinase [Marivirga sp.]HET8860159.1 shikimate kinase [Marivirga sp.]
MRYFLVGLPGSGKSHWGKIWSEKTKSPYFDLDEIIENNEGESIKDIFKKEGEEYFRNLETFYLTKLVDNYKALMLSTGGGTPCFNNNMDLMNNLGQTIHLNPPIETIVRRLWKPKGNKRPMFSHCKNQNEVLITLEELNNKRIKYYAQAKYQLQNCDEFSIKNMEKA